MSSSPLRGRRVLVTRAAEDCEELEELLRERGAAPLRMPCIAFVPGPDAQSFVDLVRRGGFDLMVVASPHAARVVRQLVGTPPIALAAVGAGTARELGGAVLLPSAGAGAEALLAELRGRLRAKRVLLPQAAGASPDLLQGLRAAGAAVESCVLYETRAVPAADPRALRELAEGRVDAIAFASGSAARGFAALAGAALAARSAVACMGKNCAEEARKAGIRVDAVGEGGLSELCDALALAVSSRTG